MGLSMLCTANQSPISGAQIVETLSSSNFTLYDVGVKNTTPNY
jgi:hypothetical protein